MSSAEPPPLLESLLKGQTIGMILLKCHEVLKDKSPLSTYDLQVELANHGQAHGSSKIFGLNYYVALFSTPYFVNVLRNNERLTFNTRDRTWSFVSPFDRVDGTAGVLQLISNAQYGLEVNQEMLDSNVQMASWIHTLIETRSIRAIRTGKTSKCKGFSADSGYLCDLYEPRSRKCESCNNLKSLTLYPMARKNAENPDSEANIYPRLVDTDIQQLWAEMKLPEIEKMIESTKADNALTKLNAQSNKRKKPTRSGHIAKIANSHLLEFDPSNPSS